MSRNKKSEFSQQGNNLIIVLISKFLPYWPLFIILVAVFVVAAVFYIKRSVPLYEATTSILFKDEKKGSDESKITESLNYLSSKKIVENEIEVLHSKSLMKEVVKSLRLYAPVFDNKKSKSPMAYRTSPVEVEVRNIDSVPQVEKKEFLVNDAEKFVLLDGKRYALNTWVNTDFGTLRFVRREGVANTNRPYFLSLIEPKSVVQNYLGRLKVTPVSKLSSVVILRLVDEVPKRAEDILSSLINSYNKVSNSEKESLAENTLSFVDERLKAVKHDLDSIEKRVQRYKSSESAIDISQQGNLYLQNVSTNDQKLSEINIQLAVLNQVEKFAASNNNQSGIVPSTLGVSDPLLNELLQRLYQAEIEYEKIKRTTGENNPTLVSIADEINKIRPSILQNIRSQRKSLEASRNNLSATNGSYTNTIQSIPRKERDLLEISREQNIKTNVYNFLLQKREETSFSNLPSSLDYRIVDRPDASLTPVSPNKKIIYLSAILGAIIIGVCIVLLREIFNQKVALRDDIESFTSAPIIGEIAFRDNKDSYLLNKGEDVFLSDQFQRLRTSFHYLGITSSKKKILITSTISGEGKSFTASNLSLTIASSGKRVVLLEADLSNPSLYQEFGNKGIKGITNYLRSEVEAESIIKETEYPNLFIIPAGPPTNKSSALLSNGRIELLLRHLETNFDYIIIDSAPVGLLTDAYILSPFCDATLYIVRQNYSPKDFIKRIINENDRLNRLKNLAIVFNGLQPKAFSLDKYGYAGYGYGYHNNGNSKKGKLPAGGF